jgi:hypothetical protein
LAFISEIHYRNGVASQTGVSEYVEVSVHPDDLGRLGDFTVVTYQADGSVAQSINLAGLTGTVDPATGWYVFQLSTPVTDPDHILGAGEAEAVAFIDSAAPNPVQSFVDIGGGTTAIVATQGPAVGETSQNIPAAASGAQSIQFDVYGNRVDGPLTQGSSVICLTQGTLIDTPDGDRKIEDLAIGDRVRTYDNGVQPIRMIHRRVLAGPEFKEQRKLWPVCLRAGSLGFGLPRRDLYVSPQHRMLYSHIRISLLFGDNAVFVRAKSLAASFEDVFVDSTRDTVTYFHLVFDRHEVIYAEGAPTESFHPGPEGLANLDADARVELFTLFPELRYGEGNFEAAYQTIRSWELSAAVA